MAMKEGFEVIVFPVNLSDISPYHSDIKKSLENFVRDIQKSCNGSPFREEELKEYFLFGLYNRRKEIIVIVFGNEVPNDTY